MTTTATVKNPWLQLGETLIKWAPVLLIGLGAIMKPKVTSEVLYQTDKRRVIGYKLGNLNPGQKFTFEGNGEVFEVLGLNSAFQGLVQPLEKYYIVYRNKYGRLNVSSPRVRVWKAKKW